MLTGLEILLTTPHAPYQAISKKLVFLLDVCFDQYIDMADIQYVHVPTNRAIVICSALADNFLFLEFLYSGALRRVTAPRGGARGTMGTIIYSAGKIRARPTEHVSDGVKNCFGCTILILLHR